MAYRRLCIDEEGGVGVSMLWGQWGQWGQWEYVGGAVGIRRGYVGGLWEYVGDT
jgi:hypothetical protein